MSFASNVAKNNGPARLTMFGRAPRRVLCPALPITCSRDTVEVEIAKRTGSVVAFNQADTFLSTDSLLLSSSTTQRVGVLFLRPFSPFLSTFDHPDTHSRCHPTLRNTSQLAFNVDTSCLTRNGLQPARKYLGTHPHFFNIALTTLRGVTSSPCETEQALNVQGTPTKTR